MAQVSPNGEKRWAEQLRTKLMDMSLTDPDTGEATGRTAKRAAVVGRCRAECTAARTGYTYRHPYLCASAKHSRQHAAGRWLGLRRQAGAGGDAGGGVGAGAQGQDLFQEVRQHYLQKGARSAGACRQQRASLRAQQQSNDCRLAVLHIEHITYLLRAIASYDTMPTPYLTLCACCAHPWTPHT